MKCHRDQRLPHRRCSGRAAGRLRMPGHSSQEPGSIAVDRQDSSGDSSLRLTANRSLQLPGTSLRLNSTSLASATTSLKLTEPVLKGPEGVSNRPIPLPPAATTPSPSGSRLNVPVAFRGGRHQFGFGRFDVGIAQFDS
jgi:hypothetical protein